MSSPKAQLDLLRTKIKVDCDTLDSEVASKLGPFVDCTSNQAILASELSDPKHSDLISKSIQQARELQHLSPSTSLSDLTLDILALNLQSLILPNLTGKAHIQVDPRLTTTETFTSHAKRILSLAATLHPSLVDRLVFKIPCTRAGLLACRALHPIPTLATTLFAPVQAIAARLVGCAYAAPYVHELRVHFPSERWIETSPDAGMEFAGAVRAHMNRGGMEIMPASLTSAEEVLALAGRADRITVAPKLLRELAGTEADEHAFEAAARRWGKVKGEGEGWVDDDDERVEEILQNQDLWDEAMRKSRDGDDERKLVDAIAIFCEAQERLIAMVEERIRTG